MDSISIDWVKLAKKNTTVCNLLVIVLVFWLEAWTSEGERQKIEVDRNFKWLKRGVELEWEPGIGKKREARER